MSLVPMVPELKRLCQILESVPDVKIIPTSAKAEAMKWPMPCIIVDLDRPTIEGMTEGPPPMLTEQYFVLQIVCKRDETLQLRDYDFVQKTFDYLNDEVLAKHFQNYDFYQAQWMDMGFEGAVSVTLAFQLCIRY
jgi:hypothetical protein